MFLNSWWWFLKVDDDFNLILNACYLSLMSKYETSALTANTDYVYSIASQS